MPNNIKIHIDRLAVLRDKLQAEANKIWEGSGFKNTSEVVELTDTWGKLKDIINDLEHLNLGIDIAQEGIKKGDLEQHIIDRLKPQLERDLISADKKIKSALRIEKKATELIQSVKEQKKEEPKKVEKEKAVKEVKKEEAAQVKKVSAKITANAKDIDTKKDQAIGTINSRIEQMGTAAYDILLKSIENNFDFKNGKIQGGAGFVKQLNKLTVQVLDLLQSEPKFTGPVSQFVKRMQPISEAIEGFQKSVNGINVPAFETAKKIVIDEIIDKMLNNGLNQHFVQPLRDLVYQNVSGGLSLSDARTQIKEYIQGGKDVSGKLGRYLEQTAIQAVDAYSGGINMKIMETFKMNGMLVIGTLIDNSSPQCRYAKTELKGIITRENWPKVEAIGEKQNGWIKGTTFDNLPANKLHHGCRHEFGPIIIKKES